MATPLENVEKLQSPSGARGRATVPLIPSADQWRSRHPARRPTRRASYSRTYRLREAFVCPALSTQNVQVQT